MKYAWLAVPLLLILALGAALYMSQPKENPQQLNDSDYVDVNGDEYLRNDYITDPADELANVGSGIPSNFVYPVRLADCEKYKDRDSRDRCYGLYALRSGDVAGCEAAKGVDSRDDCFMQMAVEVKQPALCEKVNFGKEECYMVAAIELKDPSLCGKSSANIPQCEKAVDSGKIEDCPIGDDLHYCGDAVIAKDKSLCSQLRSYDSFCYMTVAIDTNNSSLCNRAAKGRDHCFFKIATTVNNAAICESLTETRDNCVAWVAFNTGDKQLCYQAGSEAQSCIEDIGGSEE